MTTKIGVFLNGVNVTDAVRSAKTTRGQLEIKTFKFVWKFEDFLKNSRNVKQTYVSPVFQVGNCENYEEQTKWLILMFPFGNPVEPKHMFLWVTQLKQNTVTNNYSNNYHMKLAFINNAGQEVYACSTDIEKEVNPMWKIPQFISKSEFIENIDTLLVNGTLRIVFEVDINSDSDENLNTKTVMTSDFEEMFLSERFSDLTIMVRDKEIKAHKNILASRSKVFSAMFDRDTDVNNNDVVRIEDISYNVMQELLRFMYSGKICNKNINFVRSLLIAADKFDVSSLKDICENILCQNLNIKNASELLAVAHLHNCARLKTVIMIYMIKNFKFIKFTLSFKRLEDLYPELAGEVSRRCTDNKVKLKKNINA